METPQERNLNANKPDEAVLIIEALSKQYLKIENLEQAQVFLMALHTIKNEINKPIKDI